MSQEIENEEYVDEREQPRWSIKKQTVLYHDKLTRTLDFYNLTKDELNQLIPLCVMVQSECTVTRDDQTFKMFRASVKPQNFNKVKNLGFNYELIS